MLKYFPIIKFVTFHLVLLLLLFKQEVKICNFYINSLASAKIREFSEKTHLNAHGFARKFLWSSMLYRPGKSLKRHGKSSSLHSKKIFCLGGAGFL